MVTVLILCIVTLVFVIANTVLVATLHRINLKLAAKPVGRKDESEKAELTEASKPTADENLEQND